MTDRNVGADAMPPHVRAFLDGLAELLLDHVLAQRNNLTQTDGAAERVTSDPSREGGAR